MRVFHFTSIFLLLFFVLPFNVMAERYAAVICGSGGTNEFVEKFIDWGSRLQTSLIHDLSFAEDQVQLFCADVEHATNIQAEYCNFRALENYFHSLQTVVTEDDELYLFFIGHGSYTSGEIMFHLPGEDLTATGLNVWLQEINAKHIVIVNGSSSSAGFINFLSGENRIICTSTKNVSETNAPEYFEFLIQALQDGSADLNRDERISMYELAQQTAQLTQDWYDKNEYIASEHSLLDDNGDGLGTRLIPEDAGERRSPASPQKLDTPQDGSLAQQVFLKEFQFPKDAPTELIEEYLSSLDQIQLLKQTKQNYIVSDYYRRMESLLIQAATLHKEIRSYDSFTGLMQSIKQSVKP